MLLMETSTPSAIAARTRVLNLTLFLLLDSLCSCFIVLSPVRPVTLRRVDVAVARPLAPPVVILLESVATLLNRRKQRKRRRNQNFALSVPSCLVSSRASIVSKGDGFDGYDYRRSHRGASG